jgi:HEAT repeat protein
MPLIRKSPTETAPAGAADAAALIAALHDGSRQERWVAARSLANAPDAIPALGNALGREVDEQVRAAIFTSLATIDTEPSLDAILLQLRSDDAGLRTGALDALRLMPGTVLKRLGSMLRDADPDVRLLACDLARDLPSPEARNLLSSLLDVEPSENVCAAAVDVLAEIGAPDALPSLAGCAARFAGRPFLAFAVKVASERIGSRYPARHG